jgi:cytosine permease
VTVPAFVLLCLWSVGQVLGQHSLGELMSSPPPAAPINLATAATFVAGGFIVGAIFTPDMSRYNRTPADVVKQTLVGVTLGEFFVGVIAVLLAHAVKEVAGNAGLVIGIIQSTSGALGVLILCVSIVKINDWNLYPSSLGLTNAIYGLFGIRINRVPVAIVLGVVGSVLSALGVSTKFTEFLGEVGIFFPPIAAIMIADYFVVRSWRAELAESHARMALPEQVPMIVPAGLVAWAVGWAFGKFFHPEWAASFNIPAITSLVVAFVVYVVLGKLGLARGVGIRDSSAAGA